MCSHNANNDHTHSEKITDVLEITESDHQLIERGVKEPLSAPHFPLRASSTRLLGVSGNVQMKSSPKMNVPLEDLSRSIQRRRFPCGTRLELVPAISYAECSCDNLNVEMLAILTQLRGIHAREILLGKIYEYPLQSANI